MIKYSKFLLVILLAVIGQSNALADRAWHGDIHHFHERDFAHWRGGHWFHGWYGGRYTWWWIAGGMWYPYPAPVMPYPDPYQPPVVVVQPAPNADANVTSTAPLAQPPAAVPPPAAPQYWYHCSNPEGYYPYISQCQGGWQKVPAGAPPQ
jgi:hypothetical protein